MIFFFIFHFLSAENEVNEQNDDHENELKAIEAQHMISKKVVKFDCPQWDNDFMFQF